MRHVIHVDADAFFASVEQAADPRLRGKAMAVGGEKRGIIASASYEARKFGVYTPMPTARARRLCPQLVVLPGDFEKYEQFSRWMFSYAYDFTPEVEITSIDEGYFDLTGSRKNPREVAETVARAIRQSLKITVSEGLATNKLVSQIASKYRKPAAFIEVPPGQEQAFLHPLRNQWLPGIGPRTGGRLNNAGLTHIGQIAGTPVDFLALLLGSAAPTMRAHANGIDDRPVIAERAPAKTYSHQETFGEDQTDLDFIEATLRRMADSLMAKVRRDGKMVRTLTVRVRYNDMAEDRRSESLTEPTDLADDIYGRLRILLRLAWKRRVSLRLVSLKLSNLYDHMRQPELPLLENAVQYEARRRLTAATDELRETRGKYVVMRGHDLLLKQRRNSDDETTHSKTARQSLALQKTIKPEMEGETLSSREPLSCRGRVPPPFIPLHVHSYYSFLDSTLSPAAIVALAQQHQLPAIALTDHANLHGAVPFFQAAAAAGIKPILGTRLTVDGNPLLLYVENREGYAHLCRILTAGNAFDRAVFAEFPTAGLIAVAADPALAPCFPGAFYLGGSSPKALAAYGDTPWPRVAVPAVHYAIPGDRRKYAIVQSIRTLTLLDQPHSDKKCGAFHFRTPAEWAERFEDFPDALRRTVEIAERCHFEFDFEHLHFPGYTPADGTPARDFLRELVRKGFAERYESENDSGPSLFRGSEKNPSDFPNPGKLTPSPLSKRPLKHSNAGGQGTDRPTIDGLGRAVSPLTAAHNPQPPAVNTDLATIRAQIETELALIHEVGYEEYFLVVWDLLQECRRRGINWITRGSAADSLVCYCLGISDVCPVRFDLYFRRFLNRERMHLNKLPDIDIDFAHDEKDEVLDLVFEKYGTEHTAVVGGFSTFKARSALAEVAKVLGVSEFEIRRLTKRLPHSRIRDVKDKAGRRMEDADRMLDEEPYATALHMAQFLDGFPRYAKMHPCGVVVSPGSMTDLVPCFTSQKGYPTTHFDMDAVEDIGLIKIDILAQGGLAVIRDTCEAIEEKSGRKKAQKDAKRREEKEEEERERKGRERGGPGPPWGDGEVWELIASGQARAVHHIESPAMISLARMLDVRDIDTLIAQVSLIRPGAANENKKVHYAQCLQGMAEAEYAHPSLEKCLKGTFGHIVYEEQVLQVCEAFAGMSPGEADRLRRALVKHDMDKVVDFGKLFYAHAIKYGRTREEIITVWKFTCGFMGYAFCKAHSTAYGVEAYEAAWLKRYYPAEFMAAVLTNGKGFYRPFVYILECHRLGIGFLPPDVNDPGPHFKVRDGRIRVPATYVKGLTERTTDLLLAEHAREPFASLADFYRRVRPGRDEQDALLRIGALDGFGDPDPRSAQRGGGSRPALFWELQQLGNQDPDLCASLKPKPCLRNKYSRGYDPAAQRGRSPRCTEEDSEKRFQENSKYKSSTLPRTPDTRNLKPETSSQLWMVPPPRTGQLPDIPLTEPSALDRLEAENELLGFTVSGHPLELYPHIDWSSYCPVSRLGEFAGETVTTCGLIIEDRVAHQVTGELMKFMTICDWTGMVETELFAAGYKNYGLATVRYPVLEVTARVEPFVNGKGHTLRIFKAGKPRALRPIKKPQPRPH